MDKYIEFDTDSKKTVVSAHVPLKILKFSLDGKVAFLL